MTSTEEFVFTWKIVNFSRYPWQSTKDYIMSPRIHVKNFFDTVWHLRIQPKTDPEGPFPCSLLREGPSFDHGPEDVRVHVEISVNSFTKTGTYTFKKSRICTFILKEFDFNTQDCVVVCRMRLVTPKSAGDCSHLLTFLEYPRNLPPDFCFSEMWEELISSVRRNSQGSREKFSPYPKSCTGLTVVPFERRTVTCPLLKITRLAAEENLYLPVTTLSHIPDLLLTVKKIVKEEDFEMRLCFIGDLEWDVELVCEAEILCNEVRTCSIVKNCYFHKQNMMSSIFTLKNFFQWPKGKKFENSRLKLTFSIFYGSYSSFIEHTEEVEYYTDEIAEQNVSGSTTDFLGDVVLQMNNEATQVHENVFHMMYPESTARFEGVMEERKTSDLDSVTVGNALCCLCTGNVDAMQLYSAMCFLHTAADKYRITQLKTVCRKILKKNLAVETVCCALLLADAHRDAELQDSVASFISIYKEAVLRSQHWKSLESSNPKIGLEILEKVCNKFSSIPILS